MLADGAVHLLHLDVIDVPTFKQSMRKYKDRPMDFADAALVSVAEREHLTTTLTFDSDFSIRLPGRATFLRLP
jgi:predicted nucleic acid-binding protein